MVAVVRSLETVILHVAACLGVAQPEKLQSTSAVLKESRKQLREGLPPWARDITPERVEGWLNEAGAVLRLRHPHIHWLHARVVNSGQRLRFDPRTQRAVPDEQAELPELTVRARRAADSGYDMLMNYLYLPKGTGDYPGTPRDKRPSGEDFGWLAVRHQNQTDRREKRSSGAPPGRRTLIPTGPVKDPPTVRWTFTRTRVRRDH